MKTGRNTTETKGKQFIIDLGISGDMCRRIEEK